MLVSTNCSAASSNSTCKPNRKRTPHEMSGHSLRMSNITKGSNKLPKAINLTLKLSF
jgi:hypothetical protein